MTNIDEKTSMPNEIFLIFAADQNFFVNAADGNKWNST